MKKVQKKILLLILLLLIVFIYGIFFYMQHRQNPAIATTKNYTDPANNFSVTIPGDWHTTTGQATQTTGLHTQNPVTIPIEVTQLYSNQGVGVTLQVYRQTPSCLDQEKTSTTLDGFPASYNDSRQEWTIFTATNILVIHSYYPGKGIFHQRFGLIPTTVPAKIVASYQKTIASVVASLRFENLQPLNCK